MGKLRQKNILEGVPVFVAVAEAGSFSEAARRLGISPSAASQAIRSLKERLGTPILRRSTRSVIPDALTVDSDVIPLGPLL